MKHNLSIIFILLFITGLLASCGKPRGKTKVSVSVGLSYTAPLGGAILYGFKDDIKNFVIPNLSGQILEETMSLDNGKWEFFLISWDGDENVGSSGIDNPKIFQGRAKCAYRFEELKGTSVDVKLSLDSCGSFGNNIGFLNNTFLLTSGNFDTSSEAGESHFKKLYLKSCGSIDHSTGNCFFSFTSSAAFKLKVKGKGRGASQSMSTDCIAFAGGGPPVWEQTNLRIPTGDLGNSFFEYDIELFTDAGCSSGVDRTYHFENGFHANEKSKQDASYDFVSNDTADPSYFKLNLTHHNGATRLINKTAYDNYNNALNDDGSTGVLGENAATAIGGGATLHFYLVGYNLQLASVRSGGSSGGACLEAGTTSITPPITFSNVDSMNGVYQINLDTSDPNNFPSGVTTLTKICNGNATLAEFYINVP